MRWLILLLLIPFVAAEPMEGHLKLLTVSEDGERGGTADVYLQIRPGGGSVFIDSFPLTRLDTQGSTRYANQIACDFLQAPCDQYDFFYTIRAGSQIVGGPSAGAGIAALTVAVLDGMPVRSDVAVTGTINSGGIVGAVGGVNEKIRAAHLANITTVLIPALTQLNETNVSKGIVLIRSVEDALYWTTGRNYSRIYPEIQEPAAYSSIMRNVAVGICDRNAILRAEVDERGLEYEDTNNYTRRIVTNPRDRPYTLASLCFSSNIELNRLVVGDMTLAERADLYEMIVADIVALDAELSLIDIETITDLETYAIVRERGLDAAESLVELNLSASDDLAYAQERLLSARSWSAFFDMPGRAVDLDDSHLANTCLAKITEAEERIGYVRLYSEELAATSTDTLSTARLYQQDEPILCIFQASKAKAQANLIVSTLFLPQENVDLLLQEKLNADWSVLAKEQEKGSFPLLGYSYTVYAEDLAGPQPYSALTFAEYALELSNLDMYFPQNSTTLSTRFSPDVTIFILGAIFGAAVAMFILRRGP